MKTTTRNYFLWAAVVVVVVAALLRFWQLDLRPLHHDEGVNTSFVLKLLQEGKFEYDPENYHGPLLFFLTAIPLTVFGLDSSWYPTQDPWIADIAFRLAPAFLGTLLVAAVLLLRRWLGRYGTLAAMLLLALSPVFVYYSRDNIHEVYFVAFSLLTFACGYRFAQRGKRVDLCLVLVNLALMFALKETAVITVVIWAGALYATTMLHGWPGTRNVASVCLKWWHDVQRKLMDPFLLGGLFLLLVTLGLFVVAPEVHRERVAQSWFLSLATKGASVLTLLVLFSFFFAKLRTRTRDVSIASLLFLFVISILFSSFFRHGQGVASFFLAFEKWLSTGTTASQHTKPLLYFARILFEAEGLSLLLGLLGICFFAGRRRKDPVSTFVGLWAVLMFVAYSVIPYKTPWLVLSIVLPLALLAGRFVEEIIGMLASPRSRALAAAVFLLACARSAYQAIDLSFVNYDDDAETLVYVQTSREAKQLIARTYEVAEHLGGRDTEVLITSPDHWPLNWYLRGLTRVLWHGKMIENPSSPVIVAKTDQEPELDAALEGTYEKEHYALRPGAPLVLYYRADGAEGFAQDYRFEQPAVPAAQSSERAPGLSGLVYDNPNFGGKPIAKRVDASISFEYHTEDQKPYKAPFSIVWTGYLFAPRTGSYVLATESDDGSWIYIDQRLVVDNGGEHGTKRERRTVYLTEGLHVITVKYFDQYFGAIMRLLWATPGQSAETVVPADCLFH